MVHLRKPQETLRKSQFNLRKPKETLFAKGNLRPPYNPLLAEVLRAAPKENWRHPIPGDKVPFALARVFVSID